jgi:5'-nucleotidase
MSAAIARAMIGERFNRTILLNVNFPGGADWELLGTRLGRRVYEESVEFRKDPRGREYLWIGGPGVEHREAPGSDTEAYDQGKVGVTPLVLDLWGRSQQNDAEAVVQAVVASRQG